MTVLIYDLHSSDWSEKSLLILTTLIKTITFILKNNEYIFSFKQLFYFLLINFHPMNFKK